MQFSCPEFLHIEFTLVYMCAKNIKTLMDKSEIVLKNEGLFRIFCYDRVLLNLFDHLFFLEQVQELIFSEKC